MTRQDSPYTTIFAAKRLKTVELLHECQELADQDDRGLQPPMYSVLHKALQEYKERHGGGKKPGRFGPA